jgi:hypothetical protein
MMIVVVERMSPQVHRSRVFVVGRGGICTPVIVRIGGLVVMMLM